MSTLFDENGMLRKKPAANPVKKESTTTLNPVLSASPQFSAVSVVIDIFGLWIYFNVIFWLLSVVFFTVFMNPQDGIAMLAIGPLSWFLNIFAAIVFRFKMEKYVKAKGPDALRGAGILALYYIGTAVLVVLLLMVLSSF